jgi:hypothetical protein
LERGRFRLLGLTLAAALLPPLPSLPSLPSPPPVPIPSVAVPAPASYAGAPATPHPVRGTRVGYNNNDSGIAISPNATEYVGTLGGIIAMHDGGG